MADTTSLKLPGDLKEKVSTLAHECAQTPHAYMVEAIAEKVSRDERRREFVEAARQSSADLERTGVLYTHESVFKYVKAIAAGKKAPKPKPIGANRSKR
jgi:predicted transcriptional regulator